MLAIRVLSVLLVITNALANTEEDTNLEDSKVQDLELISEAEDDNEVKRAKKSATTTFCVEIRPSGPFQKPFQVCEPAETATIPEPTSIQTYSAYFASPEQPKPEAYKSASQPKANAIYSAPMKTYLPPAPIPKQYGAHAAQYAAYRAKNEEVGTEDHRGHLMRMSHLSAAEENNESVLSEQYLRAADPGHSSYGSRSYSSASYVPVVPEHAEKHRSHNGLVITCQPNLAGYAHNVPSSLHHPPALHSYSYRSSAPRAAGGNSRYDGYQIQSSSYGNYQQPYGAGSAYKQPAVSSGSSTHQYSSMYGSYAPAAPAYSTPHLPTPYVPQPSAPAVHPAVPASIPQAAHAHYTQPYHHFTQSFGQGSSSGSNPTPYGPSYGPAAGYAPAPVLPTVPAAPSTFSQTQSFSNASPHPSASAAPSAQGQGYALQGGYREAGDGLQAVSQQHKEQHTLKKMEELSHQHATGSQWAAETSLDKVASTKLNEHVESKQPGWSGKKRATIEDNASDTKDVNHEAEDDVNRIDI